MRDRHLPRLCRVCQAPMARQEDRCWRCATRWAATGQSRPTLTALIGGAHTPPPAFDREASEAMRIDADRWLNEGGNLSAATGQPSAQALCAVPRGHH
jgi:hypothetical protein